MQRHCHSLIFSLAVVGCGPNPDVLHLALPPLGDARSFVLLVQDGANSNPFVVLGDVPFAALSIDGEDLSLEDAQVEIALYACPLAGLGLEAGRGRPGVRDAEARMLPAPPVVLRTRFVDGIAEDYARLSPGSRAERIDQRALDVRPERSCPHYELERIPLAEERVRVVYLGTIGRERAILQLFDGSLWLVDNSGLQPLDPLFGPTLIGGSAQLPDGRVLLTSETGNAAWLGTLEDGFIPAAPLLPGPGIKIHLASVPSSGGEPFISALRYDSLQRFDGQSWSITATLTHPADEPTRLPSHVNLSAEESLFLHPDYMGVLRIVGQQMSEDWVGFEARDRQASVLTLGPTWGALVGASDTSVYRARGAGDWVELTPALNRGQTRFIFEVGRHVVYSDGQGTLHVHDPTLGLVCPELTISGKSLGFAVRLADEVWAVGSEWFRPGPALALVAFSNVVPDCAGDLGL